MYALLFTFYAGHCLYTMVGGGASLFGAWKRRMGGGTHGSPRGGTGRDGSWEFKIGPRVLILDGNSDKGARVSSNLYHLIWLRYLIRSSEVIIGFFPRKYPFSFMLAHHILSYQWI